MTMVRALKKFRSPYPWLLKTIALAVGLVHLSVCLSVSLSVHQSVHLSVCLPLCLSAYRAFICYCYEKNLYSVLMTQLIEPYLCSPCCLMSDVFVVCLFANKICDS